jgi:hypothetical protein
MILMAYDFDNSTLLSYSIIPLLPWIFCFLFMFVSAYCHGEMCIRYYFFCCKSRIVDFNEEVRRRDPYGPHLTWRWMRNLLDGFCCVLFLILVFIRICFEFSPNSDLVPLNILFPNVLSILVSFILFFHFWWIAFITAPRDLRVAVVQYCHI